MTVKKKCPSKNNKRGSNLSGSPKIYEIKIHIEHRKLKTCVTIIKPIMIFSSFVDRASLYNLVDKTSLVHNQFHSTLHTRQSSIQNNKYQVSHKHICFSWWTTNCLHSDSNICCIYTVHPPEDGQLTFSRLMTYICRTANLQTLHFIHLFNKYTYWIF
jgi:hypothetical protein